MERSGADEADEAEWSGVERSGAEPSGAEWSRQAQGEVAAKVRHLGSNLLTC